MGNRSADPLRLGPAADRQEYVEWLAGLTEDERYAHAAKVIKSVPMPDDGVRLLVAKMRRLDTPQRPPARCGTESGHHRHQNRGERSCDPCRDAYNAAQREDARRRKAR